MVCRLLLKKWDAFYSRNSNDGRRVLARFGQGPKDEFFQNVYADWLEETYQDKFRILRAWLSLQSATARFAELFEQNILKQEDYQELAEVHQSYCQSFVDNPCAEWLDDMAVAREWIDGKTAIQLARLYIWQHNQQLFVDAKSLTKIGAAWRLGCYHKVSRASGKKPKPSLHVYVDSDYGHVVDDEEHGSGTEALWQLRYSKEGPGP